MMLFISEYFAEHFSVYHVYQGELQSRRLNLTGAMNMSDKKQNILRCPTKQQSDSTAVKKDVLSSEPRCDTFLNKKNHTQLLLFNTELLWKLAFVAGLLINFLNKVNLKLQGKAVFMCKTYFSNFQQLMLVKSQVTSSCSCSSPVIEG